MFPVHPDHRLGFSHIPTQDKFVVEIDGAQYEMTFDQGGSRVALNQEQWLALAAKSQAFFNSFDKSMSPVSKQMWIDFNSRHEVVQLSSQAEGDSEATPTPAKNLHMLTPAEDRDTAASEVFSPKLNKAMTGLSQSVADITRVRYPFASHPESSLRCPHCPPSGREWPEASRDATDSLRDRSLSGVEGTIDSRRFSAPPSLTRSISAPMTATRSVEMPPARSLPVNSRFPAHAPLPAATLTDTSRFTTPAHALPSHSLRPLSGFPEPRMPEHTLPAAHSLPESAALTQPLPTDRSLTAHVSPHATHPQPFSAPAPLTKSPSSVAIDMPPMTPAPKPSIASIVQSAQWSEPHATMYGALASAYGMAETTLQERLAYRLLHDETDRDEFFLKPENFHHVFDALKHARDAAAADRTRGGGWARWVGDKDAIIKTFRREERDDVENALSSLDTLPDDPRTRKLLLKFLSAYIKQGKAFAPADICDLFATAFKQPIAFLNSDNKIVLFGAAKEEDVDPMKCIYLGTNGTDFFVKKDQVQAIKPTAMEEREDDDTPIATLRFESIPRGKGLGSRFETALDSASVPLPLSSPKSKKRLGARFIDETADSRV